MKLLAIDSNSILNRSFYAIKTLTNSNGFPTNAIFGFYSVLDKIIKEIHPEYIVAAFDLKKPTFRHKKYEKYKANRHKMPDELAKQIPQVKKMLSLLGIYICEREGFEADDILGTLSKMCLENKVECVIATGDRDSLQLVEDGVSVRLSTNKQPIIYDKQKILEEYGVFPKELIEVKALMGDSSDNIPGIKGIGEKTALSLVSKYHNIDNIFSNIPSLDATNRIKNLLMADEAEKMCRLSRELGEIYTQVPIDKKLSTYKRKDVEKEGLTEFLQEFELKKILNQLKKDGILAESQQNQDACKQIIQNPEISHARQKIKNMKELFFFLDRDCLYIFSDSEIFEFGPDPNLAFRELISKSDKPKKTTNLKELYTYCKKNKLPLKNVVFSCDIASYLVDVLAKSHDAQTISDEYFGQNQWPSCFADLCLILEQKLKQKNLVSLFNEVELPLAKILSKMELLGFAIDLNSLENFSDYIAPKISLLESEIYEYAGETFNINSTKELGNVLFEKLNLPTGKKTKTGYSTSAEVLEKLVKHHPIAQKLLEYRTLTKLMSTYVNGLKKLISPDGRIHSCFNQTQTRTGRISSTKPNMQNIPTTTDIGRNMRKFFVAGPKKVLIDADYSQIELRILAEISQDQKMIQAFGRGEDIHDLTASQVFGFDKNSIPKEIRRRAKIINFSVIYGISAFSLSKDIGVPIQGAKEYIDSFFKSYSGVKKYMKEIVQKAEQTGEVRTMMGRLRKIPEIKSKNKNIRAFGERIAKNTPIQATAADIIKVAMVKVQNRLERENLDANLILQVHDELLIEASEKDAEKAARVLKEEMENAVKMSVPLVVEIGIGKSWFEAKR